MYSIENYLSSPLEIEKELKDIFKFQSPKYILEIGSCDGLDAVKYARFFPKSTIIAFEPIAANFDLIVNNFSKYNVVNAKAECFALSNVNGEAKFYVSSGRPTDVSEDVEWDFGNKSSSLLAPDKATEVTSWLKFDQEINVTTKRMDNYLIENNISNVDFIHMDVQGAEIMVLEGAGEMIEKVKLIWLEVENVSLYKNQPLKSDVEHYLKEKGFTKIKDTVNQIAGDQLWINYSYFPRKRMTHLLWKMTKVFLK